MTLHLWARGACRLLDIRLTNVGAAAPPPALIVANHRGYLDIIVLAATSPALFVSKDDLAAWPVLGFLGESLGTIFLDRTRARGVADAGARMSATFAASCAVILFPEGTSTEGGPEGREVAPFHSSLFEPALRARIPVQPVALDYRTGRALAAWTGDDAFLPHLWKLLRACGEWGEPVIDVRVTYGATSIEAPDRRTAAEAARDAILQALSERSA